MLYSQSVFSVNKRVPWLLNNKKFPYSTQKMRGEYKSCYKERSMLPLFYRFTSGKPELGLPLTSALQQEELQGQGNHWYATTLLLESRAKEAGFTEEEGAESQLPHYYIPLALHEWISWVTRLRLSLISITKLKKVGNLIREGRSTEQKVGK